MMPLCIPCPLIEDGNVVLILTTVDEWLCQGLSIDSLPFLVRGSVKGSHTRRPHRPEPRVHRTHDISVSPISPDAIQAPKHLHPQHHSQFLIYVNFSSLTAPSAPT